ncbi:unnamed protein product, partial [Mesorhabditis belari]|uniref:Secreted protein n=1 Tax=Mesorhabditis belari TaxID=2138241 RepID=A0AAF3J1T3_9BILA
MYFFLTIFSFFPFLPSFVSAENVFCVYYREANEITCGHVTCKTHEVDNATVYAEDGVDMKLPIGWFEFKNRF